MECSSNETLDSKEGGTDDERSNEDGTRRVSIPTQLLDDLHAIAAKQNTLMAQYLQERIAMERKYQALLRPLFEKRAETVSNVPNFWLTCLTNQDTTSDLIHPDDLECLSNLRDIQCHDLDTGRGYTLSFHFAPNHYFENAILTKRYDVPNLYSDDEPLLQNVQGSTIDWKNNQSLTHHTVQKLQKGKGKNAGRVRTIQTTEERPSFFHWFAPPTLPPMDEMTEEMAVLLEETLSADFEVAQVIRNEIVPKAVALFTGQEESNDAEAAIQAEMEHMALDE